MTSTSDVALELALRDDIELPLLVLTDRQTAGRGRGANRWWAGDGSLAFSLVLEPPRHQPQPSVLSLAAGLAVCETLEQLIPGSDVALKWPNDVFLRGSKVCGILIDVPPPNRPRVVLGIGVNVNNSWAEAPDELKESGTSLLDAAGRTFDRLDVLLELLRQLHLAVEWTRRGEDPQPKWERVCLLSGRRVGVRLGDELVVGECLGIDSSGALQLATPLGTRRLHSGVVEWYQ